MVIDSLLSYCDPGAQGSQVEVLNAKQPGVVLLRIMGVRVRLVTFSIRVVLITAGVSVVWLTTRPGREGPWMFRIDTKLKCKHCNLIQSKILTANYLIGVRGVS